MGVCLTGVNSYQHSAQGFFFSSGRMFDKSFLPVFEHLGCTGKCQFLLLDRPATDNEPLDEVSYL